MNSKIAVARVQVLAAEASLARAKARYADVCADQTSDPEVIEALREEAGAERAIAEHFAQQASELADRSA